MTNNKRLKDKYYILSIFIYIIIAISYVLIITNIKKYIINDIRGVFTGISFIELISETTKNNYIGSFVFVIMNICIIIGIDYSLYMATKIKQIFIIPISIFAFFPATVFINYIILMPITTLIATILWLTGKITW